MRVAPYLVVTLVFAAGCSEEDPSGGGDPLQRGSGRDGGTSGNGSGGDGAGGGNGNGNRDGGGGGNGGQTDGGGRGGGGSGLDAGHALLDVPFFGGPDGSGTGCGPTEVCRNGLDDDCDGTIDEFCACTPGVQPCYSGYPAQAGVGVCRMGTQECFQESEDFRLGPCENEGRPLPVMCGGMQDWHCNGIIDEGCNCTLGTTQACYTGPPATRGVGLCHDGMQTCIGDSSGTSWGPCEGERLPAAVNICDGQDHLCNNNPMDGCACTLGTTAPCYTGPPGTENVGVCVGGTKACVMINGVPGWGECSGQVVPSINTCDGIDRECMGNPMNNCDCTIGTTRGCYDGPSGTAGVGICHGGMQDCLQDPGTGRAGWGTCNGQTLPEPRNTCDGVDRTCRGDPTIGCDCQLGQTRPCYTGPAQTQGIGVCTGGTQTCIDIGGGTAGWSSGCPGETLPGPMEICGNGLDDNCSGPPADEGCAPTITCPANTSVLAGQGVQLTASAVSAGRTIAGWSWTITSAPMGGVGTPNQWNPAPPSAASELFTPFIVGIYTIQVTATDSAGVSASCTLDVAAIGHGLRATLTWDGAGDVDLHVHNGNVSPWFNGDDCFYANCTPRSGTLTWDSGGGNNPSLDFDNVTANGPENTSIDVAVIGRPYTIGIHNYYNAAGRRATVQIFCGGATTPAATFTSNPLTGRGGSNCTDATFWKVATVVFSTPDMCTVTPIQAYGQSRTYCTSF